MFFCHIVREDLREANPLTMTYAVLMLYSAASISSVSTGISSISSSVLMGFLSLFLTPYSCRKQELYGFSCFAKLSIDVLLLVSNFCGFASSLFFLSDLGLKRLLHLDLRGPQGGGHIFEFFKVSRKLDYNFYVDNDEVIFSREVGF